jgi:ribonuclease P protein component
MTKQAETKLAEMKQARAKHTLPQRFTQRADFLRLAAQGRKLVRPGFLLQALAEAPELRLGFTATKKLGNAVIRNRAKRRLREAARLVLAERPGLSAELVLVGRRETGSIEFAKLRRNLAAALDEALKP